MPNDDDDDDDEDGHSSDDNDDYDYDYIRNGDDGTDYDDYDEYDNDDGGDGSRLGCQRPHEWHGVSAHVGASQPGPAAGWPAGRYADNAVGRLHRQQDTVVAV